MARFFRCSIVFVSLTFSVSVVFSAFATSTISASLLENVEFEPPQHPQLVSIEMNGDDTIMKSSLSSSSSSSSSSQPSSQYQFWGKYAHIRSQLDYNYHSYYHPERQVLQDSIIELMMNSTTVMDSSTISLESSSGGHSKSKSNSTQIIQTCSTPASDPWIVFTAGAMGAGKTHTIRYLHQHQHFPLKAFVTVDPDEIRRHLPEFQLYLQQSPEKAGEFTRKEAGYISEILTWAALNEGKNVLVDGSLRDHEWYKEYFQHLRHQYNDLHIAILHITASREAVLERAWKRARDTGRIVPKETLEMALEQVPKSVKILAPLVDFFCELYNGSSPSPPLKSNPELPNSDSQSNRNIPPVSSATDSNDIRIVTSGITWNSFRKRWRQRCGFASKKKEPKTDNKETLKEERIDTNTKNKNKQLNASISQSTSNLGDATTLLLKQTETRLPPSKL